MQFNIEIINVSAVTKPTAKGSYVQLDVAYKRMDNDKIEGKKIMSFTNKEVFDSLQKTTSGQQVTVTSEKNNNTGYWDWTAVDSLQEGQQVVAEKKYGNTTPKSTYETAEERAAKQKYIIRQSSLSVAVDTLKVQGKELDANTVIALAEKYNQWVLNAQEVKANMSIADMEDDIPM